LPKLSLENDFIAEWYDLTSLTFKRPTTNKQVLGLILVIADRCINSLAVQNVAGRWMAGRYWEQLDGWQILGAVGVGGGSGSIWSPELFGGMYYIIPPTPTDLFKKSSTNSPVANSPVNLLKSHLPSHLLLKNFQKK